MLKNILIIGGDSRQLYMADYFENNDYSVSIYGLPEKNRVNINDIKKSMKESDIIIFPLPISKDSKTFYSIVPMKESVDDIIQNISENHIVFGGMINKGIETKIKKKTNSVYDYFKSEDVTVRNTVPTVQGILKVIFDNVEYTVNSSKCAVFGYGRVGAITADVLKSLGAKVTVCARKKSAVSTAKIKGMNGVYIKDFHDFANDFDIIINTVPTVLIDRRILEKIKKDCLIIDVASSPYGVDFAAAYELGIKALQCPSLPGKVAPRTAGEIIADAIISVIKEENHG